MNFLLQTQIQQMAQDFAWEFESRGLMIVKVNGEKRSFTFESIVWKVFKSMLDESGDSPKYYKYDNYALLD